MSQPIAAHDVKTLTEIAGAIKFLARNTGQNVLHIGSHLLNARRLLEDGFGDWLDRQFGWTVPAAVRLMRVAVAFADTPVDRFDPGALYALSAPTTPPQARQIAVAAAASGKRITAVHARDLIAASRPLPKKTKLVTRRESIDRDARPQAEGHDLELMAWAEVERLVGEGATVRCSRQGALDDDDAAGRPYTCTVYRPGREPQVAHSKDSLASAVTLAAGTQPNRECKVCGKTYPVFDGFSRKTGNPLGRSLNCRKCETLRVGVGKKQQRGTWKEDVDPTAPPGPPAARRPASDPPAGSPAAPPAERRTPPGG